jgi:hypothetical protein
MLLTKTSVLKTTALKSNASGGTNGIDNGKYDLVKN